MSLPSDSVLKVQNDKSAHVAHIRCNQHMQMYSSKKALCQMKVSKGANNQVPHLIQDTNGKSNVKLNSV